MVNNWEELLSSSILKEKFNKWLENEDSIAFNIPNKIFRKLKLNPGKMIPQYSKENLPTKLHDSNIEILRIGSGSCILLKTGDFWNVPSIFPELHKIKERDYLPKFTKIRKDSVILNEKLSCEDSGIIIAYKEGFFDQIINRRHQLPSKLCFCGRLNTTLNGSLMIGKERIDIKGTQVECDAVLETNENILAIEAKKIYKNLLVCINLLFQY